MDSELSSPGPRTFQGIMRTPCDSSPNISLAYACEHWIPFQRLIFMSAIVSTNKNGKSGCIPTCHIFVYWILYVNTSKGLYLVRSCPEQLQNLHKFDKFSIPAPEMMGMEPSKSIKVAIANRTTNCFIVRSA